MAGRFVRSGEVRRDRLEWGVLGWLSAPPDTGASQLTVLEVELKPGFGHNFHRHPDQEEVIYVVHGTVEQWLEQENRVLSPGDSVFIPANVVHASFNLAETPATLMAILGPCVSESGYESVEVGDQEPWSSLR
jgi:quercetin dioxygenase-like cupin family protein